MANSNEPTKIDNRTFVTTASRYMNSKVIYYGELRRITFNLYKRGNSGVTKDDRFMIVTKGYEYRPDLVSVKVYGLPDYWWRIMEANGIADIFDFKAGINIRIPSML